MRGTSIQKYSLNDSAIQNDTILKLEGQSYSLLHSIYEKGLLSIPGRIDYAVVTKELSHPIDFKQRRFFFCYTTC